MKILSTVFMLFVFIESGVADDRTHKVQWYGQSTEEAIQAGDTFEWQLKGPIEFLNHLRDQYEHWPKVLPFYTTRGTHYDWVKADDIPSLFELTSDPTPCLAIISAYSSTLVTDPSTVGHEALYMIEAYRKGLYPHNLVSTQWEGDVIELGQWWEEKRNLTSPSTCRPGVTAPAERPVVPTEATAVPPARR